MPIANAKNRGYYKIKGAASAFNFDFRDKIVLDIGSSTGGFTEFALEQGARRVIAVEKGTNQMKPPLRLNPKIDLYEKTDFFEFSLPQDQLPDVIVADISFLSLRKILKFAKNHFTKPHTKFLIMLKPQFEARPDQLHKGIVKNEKIRREIIKDFETWLKANNFVILNKRDNTLPGRTGNLERFYELTLASS